MSWRNTAHKRSLARDQLISFFYQFSTLRIYRIFDIGIIVRNQLIACAQYIQTSTRFSSLKTSWRQIFNNLHYSTFSVLHWRSIDRQSPVPCVYRNSDSFIFGRNQIYSKSSPISRTDYLQKIEYCCPCSRGNNGESPRIATAQRLQKLQYIVHCCNNT